MKNQNVFVIVGIALCAILVVFLYAKNFSTPDLIEESENVQNSEEKGETTFGIAKEMERRGTLPHFQSSLNGVVGYGFNTPAGIERITVSDREFASGEVKHDSQFYYFDSGKKVAIEDIKKYFPLPKEAEDTVKLQDAVVAPPGITISFSDDISFGITNMEGTAYWYTYTPLIEVRDNDGKIKAKLDEKFFSKGVSFLSLSPTGRYVLYQESPSRDSEGNRVSGVAYVYDLVSNVKEEFIIDIDEDYANLEMQQIAWSPDDTAVAVFAGPVYIARAPLFEAQRVHELSLQTLTRLEWLNNHSFDFTETQVWGGEDIPELFWHYDLLTNNLSRTVR